MSGLLVISDVDSCSISANDIHLCPIYYRSLLCRNRPKFGILNGLPCIKHQSYLPVLADFFLVKEAAIACAYPIVSIMKLRPFEAFNPTVYSCIKGHTILFLQNPASLLNLFSSLTLALHDVIYII